jgi:hypothetical protein
LADYWFDYLFHVQPEAQQGAERGEEPVGLGAAFG